MTVNNGEIVRVTARMTHPQGDVENVFFFRANLGSPVDDSTFLGYASTAMGTIYNYIDTYLSDQLVPADIKVDVVAFSGGKIVTTHNVGVTNWPGTVVPAASDSPMPAMDSALLFLRTSGVKTWGRKFFGSFTKNTWDGANGQWGSALIAAITSIGTALLSDLVVGSDTLTPVIHSLRSNAWLAFTSFVSSGKAVTQRRRRGGVGS